MRIMLQDDDDKSGQPAKRKAPEPKQVIAVLWEADQSHHLLYYPFF